VNLTSVKRQELSAWFGLNRRLFQAYLLNESLDRPRSYRLRRGNVALSESWIDQLGWQRLEPFKKLARMLLDHLDGILNYCRTKIPMGVVERLMGTSKPCCAAAGDTTTGAICSSKHSEWPRPEPNLWSFRSCV